jgi:hypothetical protein
MMLVAKAGLRSGNFIGKTSQGFFFSGINCRDASPIGIPNLSAIPVSSIVEETPCRSSGSGVITAYDKARMKKGALQS